MSVRRRLLPVRAAVRWLLLVQMLDRMTAAPQTPDSGERHQAAVDLLIEQEHKLLDVFDARQSAADGKVAAALTAALALGTVTLTAGNVSGTNADILDITYAVVALAATVAFVARVVGSYRFHLGDKLTTESDETKQARVALWAYAGKPADPDEVRALALALWHNRAMDSRKAAIRKEKWAAGVGALLALVLVSTTLLVVSGHRGTSVSNAGKDRAVQQNGHR